MRFLFDQGTVAEYYVNDVLNQGIAEGIALGEKRGEKRGIALGEKRGRAEALIGTARNMLARGFSIEDTAEIAGLSLDEVRALRGN